MSAAPTQSLVLARRAYRYRLVLAHLASYPGPLAVLLLFRSGPAIAVALLAFATLNVLANRWAILGAASQAVGDGQWVGWTVVRLLERATASDRRGCAEAPRIAAVLGDDPVARVAVVRVADALARVEAGVAPIGERVEREVREKLSRARSFAALALAAAATLTPVAAWLAAR